MKNKKILIVTIATLIIILFLTVIIFLIKTNDGNDKIEKTINNNNSDFIANNTNEIIVNDKFELYPASEGTQDIQIGTYLQTNKLKGNVDLCTISFPKNYYIKEGSLVNSVVKEKIEGKVSDLINTNKINLEDKKLRRFIIGTDNFNYIEPASNDTIFRVSVYIDGYREIQNAYEKKIDGYTIYGTKKTILHILTQFLFTYQ